MPYKVVSKNSRLFLNDEMKDQIGPFLRCPENISKGCLSIEPSVQNILVICEHLLYRFIRTGGIFQNSDASEINPSYDFVRKYGKLDSFGDLNWFNNDLEYKNPSKITRGWCYFLSGTLHRFFFKSWDLFTNEQPLINGDYHWWLEDKNGNIVDLTEEQFLKNNILNCRSNGYRREPLGLSYSVKTRNLAFTILNDLCGAPVDINLISVSGYNK